MSLNCAIFEHRSSFADYVYLIESTTGGNISIAAPCGPQICQVIWGTGNSDISGIGMKAGYIIQNMLGVILATLCFLASRKRGDTGLGMHMTTIYDIFDSYFDCALFYAFSTELACAISVTKVTFGLNADGMGNLTLRITWAGATLTILPLIYRILLRNRYIRVDRDKTGTFAMRRKLTFPMFVVCWAIFLYTFLNKMADTFAPSQIGSGPAAVISDNSWNEIQTLCTGNWDSLTSVENTAIDAFDIAASLLICLIVMARLLTGCFRAWGWRFTPWTDLKQRFTHMLDILCIVLMVVLPLMAIGLMWSLFRLASLQAQLAEDIGLQYSDNDWSFGQIVSITIFTPVVVDILCVGLSRWTNVRPSSVDV